MSERASVPKKEEPGGYHAELTPAARKELELVNVYDAAFAQAVRERDPETQVTLDHIVASIDWKVMGPILEEYLADAGVPAERMNRGWMDNLRAFAGGQGLGMYSPHNNAITIASNDPSFQLAQRLLKERGFIPKLVLMKAQLVLVHEVCHAISEIRVTTHDIGTQQTLIRQRGGFHDAFGVLGKEHKGTPTNVAFNEALNEAVTQRLAEEIYLTYTRRVAPERADHFMRSFVENKAKRLWGYTIFASQLDSLCRALAEHTAETPEVVWGKFKRAYFNNPQGFLEDTQRVLEKIYGEDFWKRYSTMGNKTDLRDLARFDVDTGFAHPKTYPARWLAQLGVTDRPANVN
jgi:hypothetical protein